VHERVLALAPIKRSAEPSGPVVHDCDCPFSFFCFAGEAPLSEEAGTQ